jgi:hypothetical protein
VLKNEATGETIKVNDKDYLGQEWWKKKEWVIESGMTETKLVKEGYEPPVHDFSILTEAGDVTEEILGLERAFMVISYDLEKSNKEGFKKIAEFGWKADEEGIPIICMTSTEVSQTEEFRHEIQAPFEFAVTDKTTLKTIVRSNPGLVYIENGVIKEKWHYNDIPEDLKSLVN